MTKWEYQFHTVALRVLSVAEVELGVLGDQGWEAIGFVEDQEDRRLIVLLKRPVSNSG
jgi:hypothetical protein